MSLCAICDSDLHGSMHKRTGILSLLSWCCQDMVMYYHVEDWYSGVDLLRPISQYIIWVSVMLCQQCTSYIEVWVSYYERLILCPNILSRINSVKGTKTNVVQKGWLCEIVQLECCLRKYCFLIFAFTRSKPHLLQRENCNRQWQCLTLSMLLRETHLVMPRRPKTYYFTRSLCVSTAKVKLVEQYSARPNWCCDWWCDDHG